MDVRSLGIDSGVVGYIGENPCSWEIHMQVLGSEVT